MAHSSWSTGECEHHDAFKGEDMSRNHPEGWVGLNRADTNFNGSLQTTLQELAGDHPWIPGATFRSNPGLAQYLIECIHRWEPPRHDDA